MIRYAFLMTDEALSTLGKRVPDFNDYSDKCPLDFTRDLNEQLYKLFDLDERDIAYIKRRVDSQRKRTKKSDVKEMD